MPEDDAQETAQEVMLLFSKAYLAGSYDREKGRLRKWLLAIAHNQISNSLRRSARRDVQIVDKTDETGFFDRIGDEGASDDMWEQEWRKGVLQECIEEVRRQLEPKTLQAFEETSVRGIPVREVAEKLGMTTNAVYLAKHHVLKRIREMIPKVEEIW